MRRVILLMALIFMGIIFTLFGNSHAAPIKEEYELQERCGKRAEERFKEGYGNSIVSNGDGTVIMSNYTNHYNRKLNKCFVLVMSTSIPKDKTTREKYGISTDKTLWDLNENKEYGGFFKFSKHALMRCDVLEKHCNSENEWDSLVKPYMEE